MDCEHEFVTVEYTSQPYGHCISCDTILIKNEDNDSWVALSDMFDLDSV